MWEAFSRTTCSLWHRVSHDSCLGFWFYSPLSKAPVWVEAVSRTLECLPDFQCSSRRCWESRAGIYAPQFFQWTLYTVTFTFCLRKCTCIWQGASNNLFLCCQGDLGNVFLLKLFVGVAVDNSEQHLVHCERGTCCLNFYHFSWYHWYHCSIVLPAQFLLSSDTPKPVKASESALSGWCSACQTFKYCCFSSSLNCLKWTLVNEKTPRNEKTVLFREIILAFACALKEVMLLIHFIMILLQACYLKDV